MPYPRAMSCSAGQNPDFSARDGSVSDAGRLLMNRNTGARPGVFGRKSVSSNWCDRCAWRLTMLMRRSVAAPSMARGFSSSTVKARCSGRPGDRPYTVSRKRPRISSRRDVHCAGVEIGRPPAAPVPAGRRSGSVYPRHARLVIVRVGLSCPFPGDEVGIGAPAAALCEDDDGQARQAMMEPIERTTYRRLPDVLRGRVRFMRVRLLTAVALLLVSPASRPVGAAGRPPPRPS